jgi:hypothetical protein
MKRRLTDGISLESLANDETMSKLEQMYDNAQTDKERETIRKIMNQI